MVPRRSAPDPLDRMTERREAATVFRARRWLKIIVILCFLIVLTGAAFSIATQGRSLMTTCFGGFTLLGALAIFEVFVVRVELLENELLIASGWRWRRYQRSIVDHATWSAGSGVSIRLKDGSWVKLPELGYDSQSLTNSIRAWLRRTPISVDVGG